MRINVKFGGTIYNELREKMATIKNYDNFLDLMNEYGVDEALNAFAETNHHFNIEALEAELEEAANNIVFDYVADAIKDAAA